jgi:Fe-S cluster assembly protein SufD
MPAANRRIEPVPAFGDLWGQSRGYLPGRGPVTQWRERSFETFRRAGFPTTRSEAWKYTNIAKWANQPMKLAPRSAPRIDELSKWLAGGTRARRLIFVNGHIMPELSHVGGLPAGVLVKGLGKLLQDEPERAIGPLGRLADEDRGLSAMNAAFATGGAWIELPDGASLDEPLQLLFLTEGEAGAAMANTRNVIRLGRGARLRLIETHGTLGPGRGLANMVTQVELAEGAELVHDRLQLGKDGTTLINRTVGWLEGGARLARTSATLGHGLARNEEELHLNGSGIEALLNGLYMPAGQEHVDTLIRIHHHAPQCHSNQFYKGVVDGRSHAVFAGKIIVDRPAQKTDAFQSNNNLLLSDDAEIDTKPELEIYADDVKCSHGATVGDLDPLALFYLRSRGLPEGTAKSLLTYGWAGEVIERYADEAVQAQARKAVLARLPGGQALEGL